MNESLYIGRFAPTPSGPLHFGSIIAALGSYLQAKNQNGKWLVRIEDIDQPRSVAGADKIILKQLEALGLFWDAEIIYQSQRIDYYQAALDHLKKLNMIFLCSCSRKDLDDQIYPGTCRDGVNKKLPVYSQRLIVNDDEISFIDILQGNYSESLAKDVGDFVIKRRDDIFAYHLAVVVDDAEQNITEIVRGVDLLDSTPRQIYIQRLLKLNTPTYLHLPVAVNEIGNKISKQTDAKPIDTTSPVTTLCAALKFLGQTLPEDELDNDKEALLQWAINNWQVNALPKKEQIVVTGY